MANQMFDTIAVINEIGPRVPEWALLVPFGNPVQNRNGENFIVEDAEADSIVNSFRRIKVDLLTDYDHLSRRKDKPFDGVAAGWVKEMKIISNSADQVGGVYGRMAWTNKAKTAIAAGEYRYLSPVVITRRSNRRAVFIDTVGLTNTPAIEGMVPIVNSATLDLFGKEDQMDREALCKALGLDPAVATDENIRARVEEAIAATKAIANSRKLLALVGEQLGVVVEGEFGAIENSIRTAVEGLKNAGSSDALKLATTQLAASQQRITALEKKQADAEWDAFVVANSRKIAPAQMSHYRGLWDKDRENLIAIVNSSADLVDDAQSAASKRGGSGGGSTDRIAIINSAKTEYDDNHAVIACSREEYINESLREKGLELLTAADKL